MKSMELLEAMGSVQDRYVLEAEEVRGGKKTAKKKPRPSALRNLAAVVTLVLILAWFLQTPMGVAAVEKVQQAVTQLIEVLFPPKDIRVTPEGGTEIVSHVAHGREPEAAVPGFVIYVDEERYAMTEENGAWYIRPREYDEAWPVCEIEIRELPGRDYQEAAEQAREEMLPNWKNVSGIYRPIESPLIFNAVDGDAWESRCEDHYFYENGNSGAYHITCRYFVGILEGHGTRMAAMAQSFTMVAPQDASEYENPEEAVKRAMEKEAAYAQGLVNELLEQLKNDGSMTQADMNINTQRQYELWDEVLNKIWDSLGRTMDRDAFRVLQQEQREWIDEKEAYALDAAKEVEGGSLYPTIYYSAAAKATEERVYELLEYLTGERIVENVPVVTAPEKLAAGSSRIEDIPLYYREKFPEKNLYCTLRDFDGDGWGDLAVYYDGAYRALYTMEEDYIIREEYLFEEGFLLYECFEEDVYNVIGTTEDAEQWEIHRFYSVMDGKLFLREGLKYDGSTGLNKWYLEGNDRWQEISKDLYGQLRFRYDRQADNLVPLEDYYLR